ncbi:MAG TPA: class IV adenylate cyclase [Pirellulales bacterium]|nr:class IV adenylate cyclase [Pirellulales bacterium]
MNIEVEQKYRGAHGAELMNRLERLGAKFADEALQADQYFAHPCRDFAKTDEALRLRRIDARNFVTYKGPKLDQNTKTRRELEFPLESGERSAHDFCELLTALGFSLVREVRKRRRVAMLNWKGHPVEAALDDVEGLGQFVELEFTSQAGDRSEAMEQLAPLASELGLQSVERRSYLELLLAADAAGAAGK